ncbi:MAG: Na(+)/H(+) antiporter subunit D [Candidatus Binatia bacterium]
MIEAVPPATIYILGALLVPILKGKVRQAYLLLVPLAAFYDLLLLSPGDHFVLEFAGFEIALLRVDRLSLVFGYVFVIMSFASFLYALHIRGVGEHLAALAYVGSSLGVVFSGDYFSLFFFWEIMAISSVFLVIFRRNEASIRAGLRYLLVHIAGGSLLLGGIVIQWVQTGSIDFVPPEPGAGFYLIMLGFGLNAAIPPLHAWLTDAYPESTVTGSVFMTAFTTKTGVYVLARAFPGAEILAWAGAIMAVYGVIFAFVVSDIRRLLAYHIVSQVGYMVSGVGLGTEMSLNGSAAHAFSHILYKALLFMSAGAVLHVTGRSKFTELGGLARWMPWTFAFYLVGAFSISGVPLFNGFISKSMVIAGAALKHEPVIEMLLVLASVGTFLCIGVKIPHKVFLTGKTEVEAREPEWNMLAGMGFMSALCVIIGVYPKVLYDILPYPVDFHPYTPDHVVGTMGILLGTILGYKLLHKKLIMENVVILDTDWFYRRFGTLFLRFCTDGLTKTGRAVQEAFSGLVAAVRRLSKDPLYDPKILLTRAKVSIGREFIGAPFEGRSPGATSELDRLLERGRGFDENFYRKPVGWAVLLVVLMFFFLAWIFIVRA